MGPANLISLIVMTLVFVAWAAAMFRMLLRLWGRADRRLDETGGGWFAWAGHSFAAFGGFLTSDEDRRDRRIVLGLTALMVLVLVVRVLIVTHLA